MLKKHKLFGGTQGPVVTIVLDGFGINPNQQGNAVFHARTPVLDKLFAEDPNIILKAHGTSVGMPSDSDMGNSEVGHNAIGAGQVYNQGASLVNDAIQSGSIFQSETWKKLSENCRTNNSTLHLLGLFSDGNVHSHIDHLKALIIRAKKDQISKVRLHLLLDGRDVPATSALTYVEPFEKFLDEIRSNDFDICIASGGGRMQITMDRYEANWSMVDKGWKAHVLGEAKPFSSTTQAIKHFRSDNPDINDQDIPAFVITQDGQPLGPILDHDSVIFFNFRGDRAIEISKCFESENIEAFDRIRVPKVEYAGMLQYDGDDQIPKNFLVAPPNIQNTLGEQLATTGISQLAISETQKYGHVTYFWNGNKSGKFDDQKETYIEIPSDVIPFEQRPWMKAAEITDELIRQLKTGAFRTARVNYANGDMVGHTGDFRAATMAIEAVDICLGRLLPVIDQLGGIALITADHGNADEMYELDKKSKQPIQQNDGSFKAKTSHTLNPVPLILHSQKYRDKIQLEPKEAYGLSHIASSIVELLGYEAPESWNRSFLRFL